MTQKSMNHNVKLRKHAFLPCETHSLNSGFAKSVNSVLINF